MSVTKKKLKEGHKALKLLKSLLISNDAQQKIDDLSRHLEELPVSKDDDVSSQQLLVPDELANNFDFIAFSDGACRGNPGPGAWGSLVQLPDHEIIYEGSGVELLTTNNKMELQGAIEALLFISQHPHFDEASQTVLVSDSKYVVDGINQWVPGWKKRGWKKADKKVPENVELWQQLDDLRQKMGTVAFQWVRGHAGHPQNEFCDQLANQALDEAGY
jgi:ribonuclease HI